MASQRMEEMGLYVRGVSVEDLRRLGSDPLNSQLATNHNRPPHPRGVLASEADIPIPTGRTLEDAEGGWVPTEYDYILGSTGAMEEDKEGV